MTGALGFRLDLQRVVARIPDVVDIEHNREGAVGSRNKCSTRPAAKGVTGCGAWTACACARRIDIPVYAVHEDVVTARAGIAYGQHNRTWQLVLDIQRELLNASLFEVKVLRKDGSRKTGGI